LQAWQHLHVSGTRHPLQNLGFAGLSLAKLPQPGGGGIHSLY
jgi:hypothetical protein